MTKTPLKEKFGKKKWDEIKKGNRNSGMKIFALHLNRNTSTGTRSLDFPRGTDALKARVG